MDTTMTWLMDTTMTWLMDTTMSWLMDTTVYATNVDSVVYVMACERVACTCTCL